MTPLVAARSARTLASKPIQSILTPRNRPLMAGSISDSIGRNGITGSTANLASVGPTVSFTSRSWQVFAAMLSGRKFWVNPYAIEGYSGFRTEQVAEVMLPATATAAIGTAYDSTVPFGVLASAPDFCFDCTGTNDLGASATIAAMLDGKRKIWDRLLSNGILPVALSMMPRSAPASFASSVPAWNAAIQTLASDWGVPFVDVYSSLVAANGSWLTGYTYTNNADDPAGLHPGGNGAMAIARAIDAQFTQVYLKTGKRTFLVNSDTSALTSGSLLKATAATVTAGGTGYNVGDLIQLANNNLLSTHTPAVLHVDAVSSGVITAVSVVTGGVYPTAPSNPVGQAACYAYGNPLISGGSGATFTLTTATGLYDATRKGDSLIGTPVLFSSTAGWTPRFDPNRGGSGNLNSGMSGLPA